jgi:hypothetical protein
MPSPVSAYLLGAEVLSAKVFFQRNPNLLTCNGLEVGSLEYLINDGRIRGSLLGRHYGGYRLVMLKGYLC